MATTTAPSFLRDLLASPWLRPLNDPAALDDLLSAIDPLWSLSAIRARVLRVKREAPGVTTLVLQTNRNWPGHAAGQHLAVEAEVDGRRLRRTFSLSSAPRRDGVVEITVKQREGGRVSAWWNTKASVGDVLTLGAPSGKFMLPPVLPRRLVMLAAGSGITPLMAMLRDLARRRHRSEVLLVHSARSPRDMIFGSELETMARSGAWLHLRPRFTARDGRLDSGELSKLASDAGDSPAYVCGPEDFVASVRGAWTDAGLSHHLHVESFGASRIVVPAGSGAVVQASLSQRHFPAASGQTLLEAAEAAGLKPEYGCRAGICHACKCRKLDGVAVDLRDGRVLDEPGQTIQLCVTAARGPVTLEL